MIGALQPLLTSLERAAIAEPDIYEVVFARYFVLCPESRELLQHSDELMRGRMMEQVMSLFMDEDVGSLDVYFKFEVGNHEGYGAQPHMYGHLFQACKEVVRESCLMDATRDAMRDAMWDAEMEQAWDTQIGVLLGLIERYSAGLTTK